MRPVYDRIPPRGWRAERRRPMVPRSLWDHGGRLTARHVRICSEALARQKNAAPRTCATKRMLFAEICGHRPRFRCTLPRSPARTMSTGREAFGIGRRVVSQLLAGPRSGPGGSPAPPRVTWPAKPSPAGTPHPVPPRNASRETPFRRTRWAEFTRGWRGGVRFVEVCGIEPSCGPASVLVLFARVERDGCQPGSRDH
jgi:hypothetical protein